MSVRRNSGERKKKSLFNFSLGRMGISPEETAETQTITYDHAYGQYGWKNTKNVDLSVYNHIVLEIEATDSRVEIYVLYEGVEKSTCIGE